MIMPPFKVAYKDVCFPYRLILNIINVIITLIPFGPKKAGVTW